MDIPSIQWSLSAILTYRICPRNYFLSHVLADSTGSALRKQAYWLRKSQNLEMWAGSVVDTVMNEEVILALKEERIPDFEAVVESALNLARKQFLFSKNHRYRRELESHVGNEYQVLNIHELNEPFEQKDLQAVRDRIQQAILNIPRITMPDGTLLLEYLQSARWLTPNVRRSIRIENGSVTPQIDLLGSHYGQVLAIDWKVSDSKTSDYSRQLQVIGTVLYRRRVEIDREKGEGWIYRFRDIRLLEVNLYRGYVREHPFNEAIYNDTVDYISLTACDIERVRNGRLPMQVPMKEYAFTESDYACETCQFYHLCNYLHENRDAFDPARYVESVRVG